MNNPPGGPESSGGRQAAAGLFGVSPARANTNALRDFGNQWWTEVADRIRTGPTHLRNEPHAGCSVPGSHRKEEKPHEPRSRMSHEAANPPQSDGEPQCTPIIYLVDDDPSFLRALSRRLRAAAYQVQTFGSAEEFLSRPPSETAGCAVLDLQMSGLSGLELQEALAQAGENLPVVFLTGHGDVSSSVRAMKGGAVDFLTKPVRGDELLEAVQRALARQAAEQQTQRQKR